MGNQTNSVVEDGLANLQQIRNGTDPRESDESSINAERGGDRTRLERVRAEVDRLFDEHEMPDELDPDDVYCYVADWKSKIGNAKYSIRVEPGEYGSRVPSSAKTTSPKEYSIGIAKRAFDSKETWRDTVAHELAHITACIKPQHGNGQYCSPGHGTGWKIEAERLGADPTRTNRVAPEMRTEPNYHIACPNGCFRNPKQRRSKKVKHPGQYLCPECGANCVSYEHGDERPTVPGTCDVEW